MDPGRRSQGAPDLGALITACIAGVDRPLAVRALNSRLAGMAGADETATPLLRAVENLLDGVLEGSVPDIEQAMELVAESAAELHAVRVGTGAVSQRPPGDRLDLTERLDLMASGVIDVDLDSSARSPAEGSSLAAEPPLLTQREDGSRVELGRFDEPSALAVEPTPDEPRTAGMIVKAMDAVVLRLSRQVETVRGRTGAAQDSDVQRALDELSETVRELEDLKDALAKWSEESAALLSGGQVR